MKAMQQCVCEAAENTLRDCTGNSLSAIITPTHSVRYVGEGNQHTHTHLPTAAGPPCLPFSPSIETLSCPPPLKTTACPLTALLSPSTPLPQAVLSCPVPCHMMHISQQQPSPLSPPSSPLAPANPAPPPHFPLPPPPTVTCAVLPSPISSASSSHPPLSPASCPPKFP